MPKIVNYGFLYNWFVVNYSVGGASIAPAGWHVPSQTELTTLETTLGGSLFAGGALKESGTTHWQTPNTAASNSSGFTARGAGFRSTDGSFNSIDVYSFWWSTTPSAANAYTQSVRYNAENDVITALAKEQGFSIRLIKNDSNNSGTVTDYDGNIYNTVTIGTQVWTKENLIVTHYNNGVDIPEVTGDGDWAALSTGAYSSYANDVNYAYSDFMKFDWKTVFCTGNISAPVATAATNYGHNRFDANWNAVTNATGYYLDAATDVGFTSFVSGFNNKDVGNVTTYDVTGLNDDTTYYYRLRAYNATVLSTDSNTITATTPEAMLITSQGAGTGVSPIIITASAGLTLTLTGTAKFYSDVAGTLNESSTWTNATGTRYVRCPSGTAELFFSHVEKVTAMGSVTTTNSGTSFWGVDVLDFAGSASLNTRTFYYPNCVDICFIYGAPYIYFSADITDLSTALTKFLSVSGGTFTGEWANIPSTCTIFAISMTNTMSGDTGDLSVNMSRFYVVTGAVSKTGDIADLPAAMLQFEINSANTIHGDIADLPTNIEKVTILGSNTVTGDVADMPTTIYSFYVTGSNTISGDIIDFPGNILYVHIEGSNTIHGDLADIPNIVQTFNIEGSNTINGGFASVPITCKDLRISGANTISGDLADLPNGMLYLYIQGSNTVSGDLSDLDNTFSQIVISGSNTIAGNLSDLPTGLYLFQVSGSNTIIGDLANIPTNCYYFDIDGSNTISDYTHKTWSLTGYYLRTVPSGGGMSSAEVDQLLIDIDTDCTFSNIYNRQIIITGTHGAPTATSLAARNSLVAKGVTLSLNS